MRVLSFDVGIKNLAYCELVKDNDKFKINRWGIINISNDDEKPMCDFVNDKNIKCKSKAKVYIYNKSDKLFDNDNGMKCACDKHIEKLTPQLIKLGELHNVKCVCCDSNAVCKLDTTNHAWCEKHKTKSDVFINKNSTKKITNIKCTRQAPQELATKLFNALDELKFINIDEVLIENQPTLKNPVMKTIAIELYSYFVLRGLIDKKLGSIKEIKFISPSNKLKVDKTTTEKVLKDQDTNKYKLTKKLGVKYCKALIEEKDIKLIDSFKKKDDLADSFLQGFQYLFNPIPKEYFDKLKTVGLDTDTTKKNKEEKKIEETKEVKEENKI